MLEVPLGQGGGGSVWRAQREDGRYDGAVATKLLHLSLLGGAGVKRFEREGPILARLIHPHIAHLLDAGVTAGGQPYLVLELVEGARIDRHCNTQRLGIDARLALFDSVLAAVAHVHTHGVIREAGYDDGLIEVLCSQIDGDLMAGQRDKAQARLSEAQQMLARQRSPLPELEARCLAA